MLPDWVSNPGPLTYESGALPIVLRGPADLEVLKVLPVEMKDTSICRKQIQFQISFSGDCIFYTLNR